MLFGPTCDGFDRLAEMWLPALTDNDFLVFPEMGAYTVCAASRFNGMRKARVWHYEQEIDL